MKIMKYWLYITAGRGPEECCRAVCLVLEKIKQQAKIDDVTLELLDIEPSTQKDGIKSVLLSIEAPDMSFGNEWTGTIQWISPSPYRKHHKRKNWFIRAQILEPESEMRLSINDIKIETAKASGPGGQHVNKTESAIRAIHLPTGLAATASEERSQHLNKKLALARLQSLINAENNNQRRQKEKELWSSHDALERGNPVKTFTGPQFKLK